jgi:hypothetical protein
METTARVTDPATLALSHLARAAEHADDAQAARAVALDDPDRRHEAHSLAGTFREAERSEMQRAKVLAEISQAESLASIADSLARIALAQ